MILSDISIKRPVFITMVIVGLMTLGVMATRNMGVDLFPDISFPVISVTTVYPGAGPEEVEQQVTKHIEEAVGGINGVDEVRSFSRDSISTVIVMFKLEADIKLAGTDVRDKIALARPLLPKDVKDPVIARMDPTAMPILTYAIASARHPAETRRIAEDIIKPRLEAVDGVGSVKVMGGLEREIHVQADHARLQSLGLSLAQLAQQLASEGFDLPAGRIETGASELTVKTEGRYRTLSELGGVVVASLADGSQVRLRDVARVEDDFKDVRTLTRLDGEDAVVLEVQKQGGSNTVAVADGVYRELGRLDREIPKDVRLLKALDSSVFIRQNISDVTHELVFGGLMAVLVVFAFMLDWRSTLITGLSLPTSVVTTFLVMWWLGFSFNMMSLLALSLSIGLLIDDAVVVRENIFRHMEMGKHRVRAAREATAEIGLAVVATTLTIVAVFVPVGFMGGVVGRMFKQFGLTVAAAVLVSMFISFTLDPMMSARVMKQPALGHQERLLAHRFFGPIVRFYDWLDGYYRGVLRWALSNRWKVVLAALAMLVASMSLTKFMGKEFMSPQDRGEFQVNLELPAGTSISEMQRVAVQVEALIREASPHVKSMFTTVGPAEEANKATMRVYTTKAPERRPVTVWDIQTKVREALRTVPSLTASITEPGLVEGAVEYPVTLYVRGPDYDKLQELAGQAFDVMRRTAGTADVDISFRAGKPESAVRVNRARAADLGVSVGTVAQTVRLALEGDVVAKYRDGDRDVDVRLRVAPEQRTTADELGELAVPVTQRRLGGFGQTAMAAMAAPRLARVSELAEVVAGSGPATIERQNRQRQIIVNSNLDGRALGDVVADIEAGLDRLDVPPGYSFVFGGQTERMEETFANMGLALGVAILFIFFVLASQFESFVHPFTIMLALPLALVGAFVTLFLTGSPIGMPAMIGIILLMGLVTKNAILLVDYTNELRNTKGLGVVDALLEAGPTRLRPILMTSAAMVMGMLPSALSRAEGSEFRGPMALAVIGGVIASTLLTLVVVPVAYVWLDRLTVRSRRERKGLPPTDDDFMDHFAGESAPSAPPAAAALRVAGEDA